MQNDDYSATNVIKIAQDARDKLKRDELAYVPSFWPEIIAAAERGETFWKRTDSMYELDFKYLQSFLQRNNFLFDLKKMEGDFSEDYEGEYKVVKFNIEISLEKPCESKRGALEVGDSVGRVFADWGDVG
jgi:hypothetical protein